MHLYAELWNPRPEWFRLNPIQRRKFMSQVGPSLNELVHDGVELVGFALNDLETPHRGNYRYLALWRMHDQTLLNNIEECFEKTGWHTYFEQINARGEMVTPSAALEDMVNL